YTTGRGTTVQHPLALRNSPVHTFRCPLVHTACALCRTQRAGRERQAMVRFIIRRLLQGVVLLALLSVVVFLLIYLAPGDAAQFALNARANEADIQRYRHQLGLDLPWYQQYAHLAGHWIHLDFGDSLIQRKPVGTVIMERLPRTVELLALSIVL